MTLDDILEKYTDTESLQGKDESEEEDDMVQERYLLFFKRNNLRDLKSLYKETGVEAKLR